MNDPVATDSRETVNEHEPQKTIENLQMGTNGNDQTPNKTTITLTHQLQDYKNKQSKLFKSKQKAEVLLIGDSMLRRINPLKLSRSKRISCKTLPAAKAEDICEIATQIAKDQAVTEVIIHVGTNSLRDSQPDVIATMIESTGLHLIRSCPSVQIITISSIVPRNEGSTVDMKLQETNDRLYGLKAKHGWRYIDNANINSKYHIGYDGVHLNDEGVRMFARNLIGHVRGIRQPRYRETSVGLYHAFDQDFPELTTSRTTYPLYRQMNDDLQHTMTAAEYDDDGHYDSLPHQSLAHQYPLYSDAVKRDEYHRQGSSSTYFGCYNCGEYNHSRSTCRYDTVIQCHKCNNYGHKAKYCSEINQTLT